MSLRLDGRPVPRGKYACHECDNPACVRPSHLYVGMPIENTQDMIRRGRLVCGERAKQAKLTEAAVIEIRSAQGSASALAMRFGVSPSNVHAIRARKTWRHVA
jgi:hypothetical protein